MQEETPNFWDEPDTEEVLALKRVSELQQQQHNLRKGLFMRHEIMRQEVRKLRDEIKSLKSEVFPKRFTEEFMESFLEQSA